MINLKLDSNTLLKKSFSLPPSELILEQLPVCFLVCKDYKDIIYMNKAMISFYDGFEPAYQESFILEIIHNLTKQQHAKKDKGVSEQHAICIEQNEDHYIHIRVFSSFLDHDGSIYHIISLIDESDNVKREYELKRMAHTDPLTGAYNRFAINQKIEAAFGHFKRKQMISCLLYLDLDHFKLVNDNYGHLAGDEVLKQFSALIQNRLRKEDDFGRIGGEEFCIVLMNTPLADSIKVAKSILATIRKKNVEAPVHNRNSTIRFTCSIGIAEISDDIENIDEWLSFADIALYDAKRKGRDRVSVFDRSLLDTEK